MRRVARGYLIFFFVASLLPTRASAGPCAVVARAFSFLDAKKLLTKSGPTVVKFDWSISFEFGKNGVPDRILYQEFRNQPPRVLYEGRIERIPIIKKWYQKRAEIPKDIRDRVTFYEKERPDPDNDYGNTFGVSVKEGSLLISYDYGFGGDLVFRMQVYVLPIRLKYLSTGSARSIYDPKRPSDHQYIGPDNFDLAEFDDAIPDYFVISLREGDSSVSLDPDTLRDELSLLDRVEDEPPGWLTPDAEPISHYEYSIPRDRQLTWILKPTKVTREFNRTAWHLFRRFEGSVLALPEEGNFACFHKYDYSDGVLTLDPGFDSELINMANPSWREPVRIALDGFPKSD